MLSHRAGLVHEAPRGSNFDASDSSFEDHCASIADTWLLAPVGDRYAYSNLGIDLAALVLQRVSGQSFPAYVDEVLLQPLGMTRTTLDFDQIAAEADRAIGHSEGVRAPLRVPMVGAGGAYASVEDALRYVSLHLNHGGQLLDRRLVEEMYQVPGGTNEQLGYRLGIDTGRWDGRIVRNHGGGGFGFLCDLGWDPAAGLGVVVLTNSADHPFQVRFASGILEHISPQG